MIYTAEPARQWTGKAYVATAGNFGRWLKSARKAKSLTQDELSELVDLSKPQISRLENGEQGTKEATAARLARALGRNPQEALTALAQDAMTSDELKYIADDPDIPVIVEGYNDLAPQDKELVKGVIERLRNQSRRQSIGGQRANDGDTTRQPEDGA